MCGQPAFLVIMLIIIFILEMVLIFVIVAYVPKKETMVPWDTFNARFQQERDDAIGSTQSGDSPMEKRYRYGHQTEGLTTGFNPPPIETVGSENMQPRENTEIERTENALEHNLHGQ